MVFFVVCPYGPLCHPFGGKRRGKNEKTHFRKCGFFVVCPKRASIVSHVEAREEVKTKKPKCGFFVGVVFSWFVHTGLYVTHVEAREEVKTKNHVLESVVFYVTHVEAREEVKTKKTTF